MSSVRVRFAPSPTGYLHIGSARTALFNWLFARNQGGEFLVRVEDTDQTRSKPEFLEEILDSLKWLGMDWDGELVHQSEHLDRYRELANKLLEEGVAYKDGDAIIYKVADGEKIAFDDLVYGKIEWDTKEIKDQVLIKSDGTPTYNFACVVDDTDQGMTHIIRGDDHVSNTPKQILIYRALGLELPQYAHIPLILGEDRSRMSKRHGATSLREYRDAGYLKESVVNFLSLLGWSPGDDKEILSIEEIVKLFDLKRVGKTGAMFDIKKFAWMNSQYMSNASLEVLLPLVQERLQSMGLWSTDIDPNWLNTAIELYKSRSETTVDLCDQLKPMLTDEVEYREEAVEARLKQPNVAPLLKMYADRLDALEAWTCEGIEAACRALAEEMNLKAAEIIHPTRVAVTGRSVGPSLFHVLEVAGKEKSVTRLRSAADTLCV